MHVIGIETSASTGSVALVTDGQPAAERFFTKGLRHGKELVPSIDAIVREAGLTPADIDLFAVSQGPGSYTGIRVGVTCAKTLAWALGREVVGVPSLDVLAHNAPADAERVLAMLDAKRRRVYFAAFHRENGRLVRETDQTALPAARALAEVKPGDFIVGDALRLLGDELAARGAVLAAEELWLPRASVVAMLGAGKRRAAGPDDPFKLVPIYLHRPEAEEVWERKHGDK